jgi:stage II sporulation protein AB (anti-sigma F factor)
VHAYHGPDGKISMDLSDQNGILRIEIKDQGIGISDVKKAMEPMFTTKPEEERTGMGFSFMEAFMDQVEVISKQGEGTTVMTKKIGEQDKLNG